MTLHLLPSRACPVSLKVNQPFQVAIQTDLSTCSNASATCTVVECFQFFDDRVVKSTLYLHLPIRLPNPFTRTCLCGQLILIIPIMSRPANCPFISRSILKSSFHVHQMDTLVQCSTEGKWSGEGNCVKSKKRLVTRAVQVPPRRERRWLSSKS